MMTCLVHGSLVSLHDSILSTIHRYTYCSCCD